VRWACHLMGPMRPYLPRLLADDGSSVEAVAHGFERSGDDPHESRDCEDVYGLQRVGATFEISCEKNNATHER